MPQELQVLRCFSCETFQVHIVKKSSKKWQCKMCGEKQSVKQVYGRGSGKDCRLHVQKLNDLRRQKAEDVHQSVTEDRNSYLDSECEAELEGYTARLCGTTFGYDKVKQFSKPSSKWSEFVSDECDPPTTDISETVEPLQNNCLREINDWQNLEHKSGGSNDFKTISNHKNACSDGLGVDPDHKKCKKNCPSFVASKPKATKWTEFLDCENDHTVSASSVYAVPFQEESIEQTFVNDTQNFLPKSNRICASLDFVSDVNENNVLGVLEECATLGLSETTTSVMRNGVGQFMNSSCSRNTLLSSPKHTVMAQHRSPTSNTGSGKFFSTEHGLCEGKFSGTAQMQLTSETHQKSVNRKRDASSNKLIFRGNNASEEPRKYPIMPHPNKKLQTFSNVGDRNNFSVFKSASVLEYSDDEFNEMLKF